MYEIRWDEGAIRDVKRMKLRAYEVARIIDAVDEQLTYEPEEVTRNKKIIRPGQRVPFEHLEPVRQLRVGEFRVFFDVAQSPQEQIETEEVAYQGVVSVRAIRHKPGHKTTGEIL
jgi:hypothetical protein